MVTCAEAVFVVSAAEVAVTTKFPAFDPAVNNPALEIVPPVAVQVTAVFELPVTVAANCCVCPGCKVALAGDSVSCTPDALATTIVSFGRWLSLPTVLIGRTMSPGILFTSMIP